MRNILAKIRNLILKIENADAQVRYITRSERLAEQSLLSNEPLTNNQGQSDYIVSLTTYGKRIHDVHLVIESICMQTVKADRIILWLDENEFNVDNLPNLLVRQIERGLEIKFCANYKSYKKLIPTLLAYPDARIITLDDDILYPVDMIELLVKEHQIYPNVIIGHRAHKIRADAANVLLPYLEWELETKDYTPSDAIFLTTGAGTLFPPRCFTADATNAELFLKLCPNADDVWFKIMAVMSGVKCKSVKNERSFSSQFIFIPDSQDVGLSLSNVHQNMNDVQLKNVLNYYSLQLQLS